MTNPLAEYKDRTVFSDSELDLMLTKADLIPDEYFRLRIKAIIGIAKVFGKRESEIASLELGKIEVKGNELYLLFKLSKKRKRGFFQYLKYLEKHDPEQLKNPLPELKAMWLEWQKTKDGHNTKETVSLKSVDLNDKYGKHILNYYRFMKAHHNNAKYLFPSGVNFFGEKYIFNNEEHLHPKHLLRLLKTLKRDTWMHLFRETKGCQIAEEKGRTIDAVRDVQDSLDLENEQTAYRYIRRYAPKKEHS